ncbi:nickel ABC transporter permease [Paraclostridium sordellii]|uniref:Nickel import system permease protein NikB n=1 Tax=Paraclostridium sordellii TaxID=1505 RepID=A0A9P1L4G5_PARSO|nr:nickel ABC transporter permease [Paeniclostridium sordellii]CEO33237.1 peptide ABC transporter permease [[Clostridium] sordellii] [Paeniclostridium sordellii]
MKKYVLKRLITLVPILIGISVVAFLLVRIMPGDAATAYLTNANIPVTEKNIQIAIKNLGLDKPIIVQYFDWIKNVIQFDLGTSYISKNLVSEELLSGLKYTMMLAATSLLWIFVISIPLGMYSAIHPGKKVDNLSRIFACVGSSMPTFWLGFLLVQFFSIKLGILPVAGAEKLSNIILPSITLAFGYIPTYSRILRNSLLENMKSPSVTYARARGISERKILFNNVLRNSLIPTITSLGMNFGGMLSGSVIVENVFSWPGLGRVIVGSISQRDYPMIQGYIILMAVIFILSNLLADLACASIDSRIRLEG